MAASECIKNKNLVALAGCRTVGRFVILAVIISAAHHKHRLRSGFISRYLDRLRQWPCLTYSCEIACAVSIVRQIRASYFPFQRRTGRAGDLECIDCPSAASHRGINPGHGIILVNRNWSVYAVRFGSCRSCRGFSDCLGGTDQWRIVTQSLDIAQKFRWHECP